MKFDSRSIRQTEIKNIIFQDASLLKSQYISVEKKNLYPRFLTFLFRKKCTNLSRESIGIHILAFAAGAANMMV